MEEEHKRIINQVYGLYKLDKNLEKQQHHITNMRAWLRDWSKERERLIKVKAEYTKKWGK